MVFMGELLHLNQHTSKLTFASRGNMELVAFARHFHVDIAVHQAGQPIWLIQGDLLTKSEENRISGTDKPTLHIAYHHWEHYDSLRNINGPVTGLPMIEVLPHNNTRQGLNTNSKHQENEPSNIEKMIMKVTQVDDLLKIKSLMLRFRWDSNRVIDELYEEKLGELNVEGQTELSRDSVSKEEVLETKLAEKLPAADDDAPAQTGKPKRISAKQKKVNKKKQQKESAKVKKRLQTSNESTESTHLTSKLNSLIL
jgi:OTU domain-containing protein 3